MSLMSEIELVRFIKEDLISLQKWKYNDNYNELFEFLVKTREEQFKDHKINIKYYYKNEFIIINARKI